MKKNSSLQLIFLENTSGISTSGFLFLTLPIDRGKNAFFVGYFYNKIRFRLVKYNKIVIAVLYLS